MNVLMRVSMHVRRAAPPRSVSNLRMLVLTALAHASMLMVFIMMISRAAGSPFRLRARNLAPQIRPEAILSRQRRRPPGGRNPAAHHAIFRGAPPIQGRYRLFEYRADSGPRAQHKQSPLMPENIQVGYAIDQFLTTKTQDHRAPWQKGS